MTIRIGTSGWVYPHWRGVFYPPDLRQRDWFAFYGRAFDTVEINNSFYRLPSAETFDGWRKQAPAGFLYAVKASRFITHLKKLKEPEEPLRTFFERAGRLEEKLGPVLYQLPPNWAVNLSRFEAFLAALPPGYTHVVEFRDPSWLTEDVFRLMERYGVAHCIHDMYPLEVPVRITVPPAYIRLHGDIGNYGDYRPAVLERWARHIDGWRSDGLDVFVYFNNDIGGYAVKNALALKELLAEDPGDGGHGR
jgi:uncharacterized protein YecE (DUF72 family)